MVRIRQARRAVHDEPQVVIDRTQQTVTVAQHCEVFFRQRTFLPQPFECERSRAIVTFIHYFITQLQITRSKVNVEHSAWSIFDISNEAATACALDRKSVV